MLKDKAKAKNQNKGAPKNTQLKIKFVVPTGEGGNKPTNKQQGNKGQPLQPGSLP